MAMPDSVQEESDFFDEPLPPKLCSDVNDVYKKIIEEENLNPSRFISAWEMDENDVEEATEDERQHDPVQRVLWVAETAQMDILEEMLKSNPDLVNVRDSDGYTPLHRAAYEGHANVVQFLLENGAHAQNLTNDGWTSLHSAANWGQTDVASVLLRHGADINAQTVGLHTPLHLAASSNTNPEILELLLMNEFVNLELTNKVGERARDIANRRNRFHQLFEIRDVSINSLYP